MRLQEGRRWGIQSKDVALLKKL
jgi:hypothetical protein